MTTYSRNLILSSRDIRVSSAAAPELLNVESANKAQYVSTVHEIEGVCAEYLVDKLTMMVSAEKKKMMMTMIA